jgi:hypothetical protein
MLIMGENFWMPEFMMEAQMKSVQASVRKKQRQENCEHRWTKWQAYARGDYRECFACGKSEHRS